MKTKRSDDWMEQAERLGQNLAEGLERFGDRVAKAIENIENKVGPQIKKATQGINVADQRTPAGQQVAIEAIAKGDVFDQQGDLFMRLGALPGSQGESVIDAVHLGSGDVRQFERGTTVVSVDATLVVKEATEPSSN